MRCYWFVVLLFSGVCFAGGNVCSDVAVPEPSSLAMDYYRSGNILWTVETLLGWIIPLAWLVSGLSGKLSMFSHKLFHRWYFGICAYLVVFTMVNYLIELPFDFYSEYVREHKYGLSTETFSHWMVDQGKGWIISVLLAVATVWVFYSLIIRSPRRWWLYGGLTGSLLLMFMAFVFPYIIQPMFSTLQPIQNKELEVKILNLAKKAGVEKISVFEEIVSNKTNKINAYVTGMGKSSRIVIWDTMYDKLTDDQILFVVGHELGHYVNHHYFIELAMVIPFVLAVAYVTYRLSTFLVRRFGRKFGFTDLGNIASFPLLMLVFSFLFFLISPFISWFSRVQERAADKYGLTLTENNRAAAETFVILQSGNLSNPRPGVFYILWRGDHPSLAERIHFCNTYCPWQDK